MDDIELKPCPFCGGKAVMNHQGSFRLRPFGPKYRYCYVACVSCRATSQVCHTAENAREAWNRRTPND